MRTKTTPGRGAAGLIKRPEVAAGIRLLEAWIESRMAYRGLPGMSIGIVYDQELVWSRGFGHADLATQRPAAPDTIYRIASISKLFTATAVMQLRDAGRLQLDDPVERHLPWFRLQGRDGHAPVTLRQMLAHTAGLPRESARPYWTDYEFPTAEQIREALPGQTVIYPPDTKWKYSNLGLALAGEVVAAVSGEPYAAYVERRILRPLGMKGTSVELPEAHRERLATGYGRRLPDGTRRVHPFADARGIGPAAGLSSTVEDLARFAMLQFRDGPARGRQILRGSSVKEMHRVQWLSPNWKTGWGIGFNLIHREERDLVGHGGWFQGYQSVFSTSPRERVAVIALCNADDAHPYHGLPESVVDRAYSWVAPPLVSAARPAPQPRKADSAWRRYEGLYRDTWWDKQVLILNGQLTLITPTEQDPTGTQLTLLPTGPHTFRTHSDQPMIQDGDPVVFEMEDDGRVRRLKVGENYSQPVP